MNQYELAAVSFVLKIVNTLCDNGLPVTVTTKRVSTETKPGTDRVTNVVFSQNNTVIIDLNISVDKDNTIYLHHEDSQPTEIRVSELADYIHTRI